MDLRALRIAPGTLVRILREVEPAAFDGGDGLATTLATLVAADPNSYLELFRTSPEILSRSLANPSADVRPLRSALIRLAREDEQAAIATVRRLPRAFGRNSIDAAAEHSRKAAVAVALVAIASDDDAGELLRLFAFENLTALDRTTAERWLRGPHSSGLDRRDLATILMNAGSEDVDRSQVIAAMRGASPPSVKGIDPAALADFAPVLRYVQLSGRGYSGAPKMIPPIGVGLPAYRGSAGRWFALASDYPWFAGADDATFRGIFDLLRANQLAELWRRYRALDERLGDGDAWEATLLVVRFAADRSAAAGGSGDLASVGRAREMLARALTDTTFPEAGCTPDAAALRALWKPFGESGNPAARMTGLCRAAVIVRQRVAANSVGVDALNDALSSFETYAGSELNLFKNAEAVVDRTSPVEIGRMVDTVCIDTLARLRAARAEGRGFVRGALLDAYVDKLTSMLGTCRATPRRWRDLDHGAQGDEGVQE